MVMASENVAADSLSPQALAAIPHTQLVELLIAARQDKASIEDHCGKLASALQSAETTIDDLEAQLQRVQRAHERELGLLFDESLSLRAEMDYKATTTSLDNQRMQGELASYVVMEEQNRLLKESLSALHEEAKTSALRHKEELEGLRESVVEHKAKLHKEFRARVQEVSVEMAEEARGAAVEERRAAAESASVQARAAESAHHMSTLMERYQQLEAQHARVRLDYGLAQQSMELQTKEMLQLKRELLESRERCAAVEHDLRDAKADRAAAARHLTALQAQAARVLGLEDELHALRDKYAAALHAGDHWKKRAAAARRLPPHRNADHRHTHPALHSAALPPPDGAAPSTHVHVHALTRGAEEGAGGGGGRLRLERVFGAGRAGEVAVTEDEEEDVRRIWNAKYEETDTDSAPRSHTAPALPHSPAASASAASLGQCGPDPHPARHSFLLPGRLTPLVAAAPYAQLHLPAGGGGGLFRATAANGRKTAPARIFASGAGRLPGSSKGRYL